MNARLLVKTLRNVTLVPSAAVQHNGTAAFVYIVQPDNTVAVQPITTLTSNEQETAVQGVNAGREAGDQRIRSAGKWRAGDGARPAVESEQRARAGQHATRSRQVQLP